jgi:ethanolamine permease
LIFTALNIFGVKHSAIFEFVITVLAVFELLLFAGVTAPHFTWAAFSKNALPHGWIGVLPAIPYAIWFYLAIEGVANVAEETKNPQKDLALGFSLAMATLVILTLLTFFTSVGVGGWEAVVFKPGSTAPSDSPLPLALGQIVGQSNVLYHLLITIGLCGLLASFHGIILVAGRATFEFGRVGYAPKIFGTTLEKRQTPAAALVANMLLGFAALLTGRTSDIITISVFGALTMYVLSISSMMRMRATEPDLPRPFKTPFYPWSSGLALVLSVISLGAMIYYNQKLALLYVGLLAVSYLWYYLFVPLHVRQVRILHR